MPPFIWDKGVRGLQVLRMEDPLEGGYHCRWAHLASCGTDINYGDSSVPAAILCATRTRVVVGQFCQLDFHLTTSHSAIVRGTLPGMVASRD